MKKARRVFPAIGAGILSGLVGGFLLHLSFQPGWDEYIVSATSTCNAPLNVPPCTTVNLISDVGGQCDVIFGCYMPDTPGTGDCMMTPMSKTCRSGLGCYLNVCIDQCRVPPGTLGSCTGLLYGGEALGASCGGVLGACYYPDSPLAGPDFMCMTTPIPKTCAAPGVCAQDGICRDKCKPVPGLDACSTVGVVLSPPGGPCGGMLPSCYQDDGPPGGDCMVTPITQECDSTGTCQSGTCVANSSSSSSSSASSTSSERCCSGTSCPA